MTCTDSEKFTPRQAVIVPSLAAIDAELARRQRRPQSPAELALKSSNGRWHRARHLDLLNEKLVALAERRISRLIVTMPPRNGKSQLCSKFFPAWYLGTRPDHRIILCSYEANFAADWGGKARDVLNDVGRQLFGVTVRNDSSARDAWNITGREGGMSTAGVGGPITGKGADLLILDDPIKNAEEAQSETYREKMWAWWNSTAYTRLEPSGVALVVLTRWHQDDIAGRLMKQDQDDTAESDERWEVLNLPAIAEENDQLGRQPGEPLWPERGWTLEKLARIAKRVGQYVWNALFQQHPSPLEGGYFKRHWFKIVPADRVPRIERLVRCWDLAATAAEESSDPDWLVGTKMGLGADGDYYVLSVYRDRISAAKVESTIKQYAAMDGVECAIRIEQEGAASGKIVKYHFERMLDGYDARFTPIPRASKLTRSGPYNATCERGQVHLVGGACDLETWIEEHATFPNATHDDQVDSAVGAYTELVGNGAGWDASDIGSILGMNR